MHGQRVAPFREVVALFVDPAGVYANRAGVDCWGKDRDARTCREKKPAVGHPPCQRWGKFATGGTHPSAKRQKVGDDGGCFAACHAYIKENGGVLEHPKDSKAWAAFGLNKPPAKGGWVPSGDGGWTCCVWQGHYGHFAGKATWLLAYGVPREALPELKWGKADVPLPVDMVAKHGIKKARRIGAIAWVGRGKHKTRIREATPPAFAEILLAIARKAVRLDESEGEWTWACCGTYWTDQSVSCSFCGGRRIAHAKQCASNFRNPNSPTPVDCDCSFTIEGERAWHARGQCDQPGSCDRCGNLGGRA